MDWYLFLASAAAAAAWLAFLTTAVGLVLAYRQLRQGMKHETERYINLQIDARIGHHLIPLLELNDRTAQLKDLSTEAEVLLVSIREEGVIIRQETEAAQHAVDGLVSLLQDNEQWLEAELKGAQATLDRMRQEELSENVRPRTSARDTGPDPHVQFRLSQEQRALQTKVKILEEQLNKIRDRVSSVAEIRVHSIGSSDMRAQVGTPSVESRNDEEFKSSGR